MLLPPVQEVLRRTSYSRNKIAVPQSSQTFHIAYAGHSSNDRLPPPLTYFLLIVVFFADFFFAGALVEDVVFFAVLLTALFPDVVLRVDAFFAGAAFFAALFVALLLLLALFAAGFFSAPLLLEDFAVAFFAPVFIFFALLFAVGLAVREVPLLFAALLPVLSPALPAPALVGSFLRLALAIFSSSFVLMDSAICFEAPFSEALLFSPRFAESAAPAAICCFLDFAGINPVRSSSGKWPFTHLSTSAMQRATY